MTYFWPEGAPIKVEVDAWGTPLRLAWQGCSHPVQGILNRWRVDVEWWQQRIWREYFKLHTETGLLLILYHDFLSQQWVVQRLYD